MNWAVLDSRKRSEEADPFNWVTRAKLQSVMNEHYHRCKEPVEQHLEAYYGNRQASVFARAGVTAHSSAELFESQAAKLVGMLAESARPLAGNEKAFQMVVDMAGGFLSYIDMVVGRIGPRIELELRNLPRSETLPRGAGELWAESRARVLASLARHRAEFGLPEEAAPLQEPAGAAEMDYLSANDAPDYDLPNAGFALLEEPAPIAFDADEAVDEADDPLPILELDLEAELAIAEEAAESFPDLDQWHDMWAEIAVQLCMGRLAPENRGQVSRAMSDWFAARGWDGLDAELDDCTARFWKKFAPRRVTCRTYGEADTSSFDRMAWQSDPHRSGGFASGSGGLAGKPELRCSVAALPPVIDVSVEPGQGGEQPEPGAIRYHVSWSMRRDTTLPAPVIEFD